MIAIAVPDLKARVFCPLVLMGFLLAPVASPARAQQSLPDSITAPGSQLVMAVHAIGAQIYECAADTAGRLGWRFREPIAALLINGRTVGRHFVGPSWQLADGSLVVGKVAGSAPGATNDDIPWLKLTVAEGQASGQLATVTMVQRINTSGGSLTGACGTTGALRSIPYSSDYIFLAKGS